MTPLENDLTTLLREHADDALVPMPPAAELVRLGRAEVRRRRTRSVRVSVAVAVLILALVPWLALRGAGSGAEPSPSHRPSNGTSSSQEAELDGLAQGIPIEEPYLLNHELVLGRTKIATAGDRLLAVDLLALVERTSETDPTWWLLKDSAPAGLVRVPELQGVQNVELAPEGDFVAYVTFPNATTTRVTAWGPYITPISTAPHVDLPTPPASCCGGQGIKLLGVDGHQNVYWRDGTGAVQVWRTADPAPHRLSGAPGDIVMITPDGPVVRDRTSDRLGQVDPSGRWTPIAVVPDDPSMVWSTGGTYYVTGLQVADPRTGHHVLLGVPAGVSTHVLGFANDDSVLVDAWADPLKHYVLRCDPSTGYCERALEHGAADGFQVTPFPN